MYVERLGRSHANIACCVPGNADRLGAWLLPVGWAQQQGKPYKVTIAEDKAQTAERVLPVDPTTRITLNYQNGMNYTFQAEDKTYSLSVDTEFMIDGNRYKPNNTQRQALPPGPNKKKREGGQAVWQQGDVRITMSWEVVPGKPSRLKPGQAIPRRMDTELIKFTIENLGKVVRKVGCRMSMDVFIVDNDGALFASPATHPNQVLNGVALFGKQLPPFFEALQVPDFNNSGERGVFTLKFGSKMDGPSKAILTNLGAARGEWDPAPQDAGDAACVLLWQTQEIQPRGKRECVYAFGQGVACVNDAELAVDFGGSFEPSKRFTITAHVTDPVSGQTLTLLLPKGVERVDGKETQIVPTPLQGSNGIVVWRCSLREVGTFPIRIRSSTGETKAWTLTVRSSE